MTGAVLALIGAVLIGAGLARQHAAAGTVEAHAAMDPRIFLHLLRRRSWLVGVMMANGGFVFIATGIATGSLAIVEPIGATQVLFALLVAARATGRRLSRAEWIAAGTALAGLAGFLVAASPTPSTDTSTSVSWVVPLAALATIVGAGFTMSRRLPSPSQGLVLAMLAGLAFGTADALIKVIFNYAGDHGASSLTAHWPLYAWMVVGALALLLQQSAYHATHLGAAMPATCTLGPTTATLLGTVMLGEHLRGGWAVPVEVAFFGLLLVGVARLAASPVLNDSDASVAPSHQVAG